MTQQIALIYLYLSIHLSTYTRLEIKKKGGQILTTRGKNLVAKRKKTVSVLEKSLPSFSKEPSRNFVT